MTTTQLRDEARAYYRLCDEARALGIPVSLDDPRAPNSVDALRAAVASARQMDAHKREPRTSADITADLRELTAQIRGQHARFVADREREEAAPGRRASLTLVPTPPEDEAA